MAKLHYTSCLDGVWIKIKKVWINPNKSHDSLAADRGLSGQDAFRGRTFGRFPASLFSPLALSSNWILILIQLLQVKDRQNVTHKQTDTVSKVAHFCDSHRAPADLPK